MCHFPAERERSRAGARGDEGGPRRGRPRPVEGAGARPDQAGDLPIRFARALPSLTARLGAGAFGRSLRR